MVQPAGETPVLLDRETELASLERALERAAAGAGTVLVIEGPPGIGKTSLLDVAAARGRSWGLRVLRARGGELERGFGFGVARQLVGRVLEGELLDGAAALAAPALGRGSADAGVDDPLFAALHGLHAAIARLATEGPVVLVVDDGHWADEPSQRLLAYLAARIAALPVALLVATWPVSSGHAAAIATLMAEPETVVLRPPVLAPADVASALALAPGLGEAAHRATGGNPFLVHALGRELAGPAEPTPEQIGAFGPREVADAVLRRVATAPPGARALAEAVAVLGEDPDRRHAAALAGLEPAAAGVAADALVELHVLAPARTLRFVHPLVGTSVLRAMGEGVRSARHADAARLRHAAAEAPEAVAAHLLHTLPAGDGWVVARLEDAARAAAERGTATVGILALRRALAEPPSADRRGPVLAALGLLEARAGDTAADDHLAEAVGLEPDPAQRAQLAVALGSFRHVAGDPEGASAALTAAAAGLGPDLRDLRVALAAGLHALHRQTSAHDPEPAFGLSFTAGELAGDTPAERSLLVNIAMTEVLRDAPPTGPMAIARRVLAQPGLRAQEGMASYSAVDAATVLVLGDAWEEADGLVDEVLAAARSRGDVGVLLSALTMRSFRHRRFGALAASAADALEAHTLAREAGLGFYGRFAAAFAMDGHLDAGRVADAEAVLAESGFADDPTDDCQSNTLLLRRGRLREAQGRRAEAIADTREAGRRLSAAGMDNPAFNAWRSTLALLLRAEGEAGEARALAAEELEVARRVTLRHGIARAALTVATVAPGAQRVALLRVALAELDELDDPLLQIQARLEFGAALRHDGRRDPARRTLRDALDIASRCGAVSAVAAARAALIAAGGRPRSDRLRGPAALTPSELRVARLAADGLTNTTIAERLVVVPRTVEMHLTAAFRKLDVASRGELAAALALAATLGDHLT